MLTAHPQFARTIVNLIWAEMFGAGLVDPPLDWDLDRTPRHAALLDALANDFVAHGYSLRHVIRLLANSSTYQLSHRYPGEWKPEYAGFFARRVIRRLPAEQIWDAISDATGVTESLPVGSTGVKAKYVQQTVSAVDMPEKLLGALNSFGLDDRTFSARSLAFTPVQSSQARCRGTPRRAREGRAAKEEFRDCRGAIPCRPRPLPQSPGDRLGRRDFGRASRTRGRRYSVGSAQQRRISTQLLTPCHIPLLSPH